MAFRDELDAAHARIQRLEEELRLRKSEASDEQRLRADEADARVRELRAELARGDRAHKAELRRVRRASWQRSYASLVGKNAVAFYFGAAFLVGSVLGCVVLWRRASDPVFYRETTCAVHPPGEDGRFADFTLDGKRGHFRKRTGESWSPGSYQAPCWVARERDDSAGGTLTKPANAQVPFGERFIGLGLAFSLGAFLFGLFGIGISRFKPAED